MCTCIKVELEFRVSVFVEGGKPENPEKNPRSKDENQQQTQPTYGTGPESNPGHIGGRQALSPLSHPCSPINCHPLPSIIIGYLLLLSRLFSINYLSIIPAIRPTLVLQWSVLLPRSIATAFAREIGLKLGYHECLLPLKLASDSLLRRREETRQGTEGDH